MPVGHRNTATSNGQATAVQRPAPSAGRAGRPGCTRYQWPSSIASLTLPRNTAPTSEARGREQVRAAGELRRREQADRAEDRRDRGRATGGNSGAAVAASRASARPIIAATRARRAARTSSRPRTPARAALHRHRERDRASRPRTRSPRRRRRRAPRRDRRVRNTAAAPRHERAEDDADQPAVAEADLAAARRDPAEQQPAGRPLQQERRGVELHATIARSRGASLSRNGPSVGRDDDVLEPHPEPTGEVDARLDAERVARLERRRVARDHVRILVRLGADAVPDAVHEVLAEARVGDDARATRRRPPRTACRPSRRARRPPAPRRARRTRRAPRPAARRRGTCA